MKCARHILWPVLATGFLGSPTLGQEASADREQLDMAAGRAIFQNAPIATTQRFSGLSEPSRTTPAPTAGQGGRRVRVVLPSPYQR